MCVSIGAPVLLVSDVVDSRWAFTAVAQGSYGWRVLLRCITFSLAATH